MISAKQSHKKGLAIFMVFTLLLHMVSMIFTPTKADAASKKVLKMTDFMTKDGVTLYYPSKIKKPNGEYHGTLNQKAFSFDGRVAFCIEHGVTTHTGAEYNVTEAERFKGDWRGSSAEELTKIVYHGYLKFGESPSDSRRAATQFMIWEAMGSKVEETTVMTGDAWKERYPNGFWDYKKEVMAAVKNHDKRPSFHNQKITLNEGESITLDDKNGVFNDFKVSKDSNDTLGIKRDGNKITITAKANSKSGKIKLQKFADADVKKPEASLVYHEKDLQTIGEFYLYDPVPSTIDVEVIQFGSIEINKKGNDTDKGLSGATYEVYDGDKKVATVTTGKDGKAKVDQLLGNKTYTIKEVKAPHGYTIDAKAKNVKVEAGKAKDVTFTNEVVLGQINVTKEDSKTGTTSQGDAKLGNESIEVRDIKGDVVDKGQVPHKGTWTSKKLPLGEYTVVETKAGEGYNLQKAQYPVSLTYKDQNTAVVIGDAPVKNEVIKGKVEIEKYAHIDLGDSGFISEAPETDFKSLAGAEFTFTLKSDGKVYDKIVTDEKGYAITKDLPFGTYIVKETKTPKGYIPIGDFEVKIVENNKKLTYKIVDGDIKKFLKIIKQDKDTKKPIAVAGTAFKVKDLQTGEFITQDEKSEYVTNEEGYIVLPKELKYGKYELHEVKAPEGYVLSKDPIPFEVNENIVGDTIVVAFGNFPQLGSAVISKTGEMIAKVEAEETEFGNLHKLGFEQKGLAGATFNVVAKEDIVTNDGTVRAKAGDVVDEIVTGEDGTATTKDLNLGQYEFIEVEAPKGYVIDPTPIPFELDYAGQEVEITNNTDTKAVNHLQGVAIHTHKVDEQLVEWKDGEAVTELTPSDDKIFGLFTREAIKHGEDVIVPEDALLGYAQTTEGVSEIAGKYPAGKYYIQELKNVESHVVSEKQYDFTLEFENNNQVYDIFVWDNAVAYNQKDNVQLVNEKEEVAEDAAEEGLEKVSEESTEPTDEAKDVEDAGSEVKPIVNKLVRGGLKITKTDVATGDLLSNAKFEIKNEKGEVIRQGVTDEKGIAEFDELPYGKYTYREYEAPEGYVVDETEFPFEIKEDGEIIHAEMTNKPIEGNLEITKTDVASGEVLPSAKFEIKNEKGEVVQKGETNEKGIAYFENLTYGKYTYREYKAPGGYIIDETEFPFEIKKEGEIVKAVMTNKAKEVPTEPEKPGKPEQTQTQQQEQKQNQTQSQAQAQSQAQSQNQDQPQSVLGKMLPNTATEMFNMLLVAAALLLVGGGLAYYMKKRKKATDGGVDQ